MALGFAGLTSAVSLVEPMIQYLIDRWDMSRFKAAVSMGLFFTFLESSLFCRSLNQHRHYLVVAENHFLIGWII